MFQKEDIQVAKKHIERFSTLLVIRKIQIKTTTGYQNILIKTTM